MYNNPQASRILLFAKSRHTMKAIITILLAILTLQAQAQTEKYNKALADSLGADDYGMKSYVLVMLKTGPVKMDDKEQEKKLFAGHMSNMDRLVKENKLIVAGPLKKNDKNYRGIFILNVKTVEEAAEILKTDPAIQAKILDAELYGWYGSAALPMYLPYSETVQKKSF